MIQTVTLRHYRGFESVKVPLAPSAYIVGPNSAGKSTIIESVALAEKCLQRARRQAPSLIVSHREILRRAYPIPAPSEDEGEDPVRYEFGQAEAVASIAWSNGASLHMVWPPDLEEGPGPFFYLEVLEGFHPNTAARVKGLIHPTAIIPIITPLDRLEDLKSADYVRSRVSTRLASRHFRNHAFQMHRAGEWDAFRAFAREWTPEIELLDVSVDYVVNRLSVFYLELGSRVPKELAWAGDGMQIWLQLLWHIHRSRDLETLVLDEPEVYLHPDIQRRLVRLLESLQGQVILASHSADIVSEARSADIVWVDRRRGVARKVNNEQTLSALSNTLGTSYNLAVARSMRSQLVVATDCQDLAIIRILANRLGAVRLANDNIVNLVQLKEVSTWQSIPNLGHAIRELLPDGLPAVLLLEGGQRSSRLNDEIAMRLTAPENTVRFMKKPDIVNYLLDPHTLGRLSGAAPEAIEDRMDEAVEDMFEETRARFLSTALASASSGDAGRALGASAEYFDESWSHPHERFRFVRGQTLLSRLNTWLSSEGYRNCSPRELAKSLRTSALDGELIDLLLDLDDRAQAP